MELKGNAPHGKTALLHVKARMNPFNGIERLLDDESCLVVALPPRIRSMELKAASRS